MGFTAEVTECHPRERPDQSVEQSAREFASTLAFQLLTIGNSGSVVKSFFEECDRIALRFHDSLIAGGRPVHLADLFEGWEGYQASLLHAVRPLTPGQLAWRPTPGVRSLGEVIRHLALGRITWLARMGAPGVEPAMERVPQWYTDGDGARHVVETAVPADHAEVLAEWLAISWRPIEDLLAAWTPEDLRASYIHRFRGTDYRVSRQWTLWRILSHDLHHGGQIAFLLGMQGIDAFELRALGGHIVSPPVVE